MTDDYLSQLERQFSQMLAEKERVNPTPKPDPGRERVITAVRVGCIIVFLVAVILLVRGVTR